MPRLSRSALLALAVAASCAGAAVLGVSAASARVSWQIGPALAISPAPAKATAAKPVPATVPPAKAAPASATPTTAVPTTSSTAPAAAASTGTSPSAAAGAGGFSLVHTYTFTGATLDPDWAVYDTSYTSTPDARVPSLVTVSGGALHIATVGAEGSGLCLCKGSGKPSAPYGRWDIRARASQDADHGFAILLWPNAENWPVGGEIDIAEFPGTTRSMLQTTVHFGSTNAKQTAFTPGSYTDWHTYSVIWTRTSITYLVDDQTVMTVTNPAEIPTGAMHLAMQAGVNTGVTAPSNSSATLDVQWVKIYR